MIAPIPEFQQWQEDQATERVKKHEALSAVAATAKQSRELAARPAAGGKASGRGKEAFGRVVVDNFREPSFACALANTLVCRNTWVKAG